MTRDEVKEYFLSKKAAIEEFPFNISVPVYKVGDKMFGLLNVHEERASFNVKNYKEENLVLREMFEEIVPGYHMNKAHWNTIYLDGNLDDDIIKKQIDISYEIVFNSLTKKKQKEIMVDSK
ncbi:MmcQ/YjbR family DNA-binding protein [Clostridium sediminicola]|uniref:MmcQ/YjbR family DNA-binding protein n=1 Tax=Clostridium sediminicola TaxID=3114879 RepID=UPI0031F23804